MNITHYSVVKVFYTIQYRENVRNATRRTLFSSNTLSTVENPWRMLAALSSLVNHQKASDFLHRSRCHGIDNQWLLVLHFCTASTNHKVPFSAAEIAANGMDNVRQTTAILNATAEVSILVCNAGLSLLSMEGNNAMIKITCPMVKTTSCQCITQH